MLVDKGLGFQVHGEIKPDGSDNLKTNCDCNNHDRGKSGNCKRRKRNIHPVGKDFQPIYCCHESDWLGKCIGDQHYEEKWFS